MKKLLAFFMIIAMLFTITTPTVAIYEDQSSLITKATTRPLTPKSFKDMAHFQSQKQERVNRSLNLTRSFVGART